MSGSPIGINLNGRRYGQNHSTIIAWDDANYAYSGLKTENGRVVACPLSEAEDFYFAVVNPVTQEDHLTTVGTIDNNDYGITMKMIDYNNPIQNRNGAAVANSTGGRDSGQTAVLGYDTNLQGLLSTQLEEDGYPLTNAANTGKNQTSLSQLYHGAAVVNHLFISSIHNESGYFEYNSTQNFAHLNGNSFTVYDQLGAIKDYTGATGTGRHGQFLPYNDITAGNYCPFNNTTNVLAQELSDLNPRKNEKLYNAGQRTEIDYFFGMELSASFTQTPSGLDAWGHDIIFEFSGDDDFWLYVDGELILDLGGVHSAMTGSVNFRTGEIKSSRGNSTLYQQFQQHYQDRGFSASEVNAKLEEIFTQNANGQYVFKDYTNHDMKIFYMERGAGASNLHMRFNLAAVKPGTFVLSKKLTGTDNHANDLIEFPYQIYYKQQADGGSAWHLLTDKTENDADTVYYNGTILPVTYLESFTPAGGTESYDSVFFLKPGQSAEVMLPDDVTVYYVVECGVNPDIYDKVLANGDLLTGSPTENRMGGTARMDFATAAETLQNRNSVDYENHVKDGAMRTLNITKKLYSEDGTTLLSYPDNDTLFTFRLYLGSENAEELPLANMYAYCVRDKNGEYCRWDSSLQRFVSLGKTDYGQLSDSEKEAATFYTSMNGSISKIPTDHTVEIRDLIIGTQYMVEERNYEVPRGYTLRSSDGYTRVDVSPAIENGVTPYSGTIYANEDPSIQVRNQKGWGMTVEKHWTDQDFMSSHDDIYFAVYIQTEENGEAVLYEDRVYRYSENDDDLYIFFEDLKYNGETYHFADFSIREVRLTGDQITVDEEGKVTGYTSLEPVDNGQTITVGGVPKDREHQDFSYTVHYEVGTPTGHNENVRTDTVTNSRPGIILNKTDMEGFPLSGAVFTLTDENGNAVGLSPFTSNQDGLITIAYLAEGVYTLTEIGTPKGYVSLENPIQISIDENSQVSLSPASDLYQITADPEGEMLAVITVKNRTTGLLVRKVEAVTKRPLEGVHFALYPQVTAADGSKRKDYLPIHGYEDIITDENGILHEITADLPAGVYYLTETEPPEGFAPLKDDLCFAVGLDGKVTVENHESWLTKDTVAGVVSYTLTIPNGSAPDPVSVTVSGVKVLLGRDMKAGEFSFTLTPVDVDGNPLPNEGFQIASCAEGSAGTETVFSFPPLTYELSSYQDAEYHDTEGNALFYYLVEELTPEGAAEGVINGIIYSTEKYLVVVTLSYEDDELNAVWKTYPYDGNGVPETLRPINVYTTQA